MLRLAQSTHNYAIYNNVQNSQFPKFVIHALLSTNVDMISFCN